MNGAPGVIIEFGTPLQNTSMHKSDFALTRPVVIAANE
jgi:hypothetical protein